MTGPIAGRLPALWLCGPPGVGKSTVGWRIFEHVTGRGVPAAFVDIDQVGICHPAPPDDPNRYRLKDRNLDAVVANAARSGARCLVVAGVADPARGVDRARIPHAALTVVRLRADTEQVRHRFLARGFGPEHVEGALQDATQADLATETADVCIDTSGRTAEQVTARILAGLGDWPDSGPQAAPAHPAIDPPGDGSILWLCGPRGVGTSTAGFGIHLHRMGAGLPSAYIDLDQIGFLRPARPDDPRNHRVTIPNVVALWRAYHALGVRRLVLVGPVEDAGTVAAYRAALHPASLTVCRLHAGPQSITERILGRGTGGTWAAPGDPLIGRPTAHLLRVAEHARAEADALERAGLGDLRIDTDGLDAPATTAAVLARIGECG